MLFLVDGSSNKSFILPEGIIIVSLSYMELSSADKRHMTRMARVDRKRMTSPPKRIAFYYKSGLRTAIVGIDVVLVS